MAASSQVNTLTVEASRDARTTFVNVTIARTPGLVVRRARSDDAPYVAWLAALTFPLACPPGTTVETIAAHIATKLGPAQFRSWATSAEHALVVAERANRTTDDPAIVGYALVVLGRPDGEAEAAAVRDATGAPGPYLELSKIYVHPDARGTGVADELMVRSIEAAAALGSQHAEGLPLWLGTNALNTRAQGFYRRHGFGVVGHRTYDVGGVEHDDVVMLHTASWP